MRCPICQAAVNSTDFECSSCGEMLSTWRGMESNSELLRERGRVLAQRGDFVGACLSFLESGLTNPLDTDSLVDAGKCLAWMRRADDAVRILQHAQARSRTCGAQAVIDAIQALVREADEREGEEPDLEAAPQAVDQMPSAAEPDGHTPMPAGSLKSWFGRRKKSS